MLQRLYYRSKATNSLDSVQLFKLLNEARERNAKLDITGHLLYSGEVFVQWIEGPSDSLDSLWQSLQRDPRHYDIELLAREPLEARKFGEWSMAASTYSHLNGYDMPGIFPIDS